MKFDDDKIEQCEYTHVHGDIIDQVQKNMPPEDELCDLTEFFRVFGDTTRIKILYVLFEHELCVCDLAQVLGMTQSAISHQLRVLKHNRLVKFRKAGKEVYYSLSDNHVHNISAMGYEHIKE